MAKIIVLKSFKFAERGVEVIEYTAGPEAVDCSDECAEVAISEKWAKAVGKRVARDRAPEATSADSAPEVK